MRLEEERALLTAAAAPTFERIRRDQETASAQVRPLLCYLEDHLFDHDLYVDSWLRACSVADRLMAARFHYEMGLGLATYFWDCRLDIASRLLRSTPLSILTIGQMVGYAGRKTFDTAFEKWSGETPAAHRGNAVTRVKRYGSPPEWMLSTPFLQRLEAGQVTSEEAQAVRERLRHLIDVKGSQSELPKSSTLEREKADEHLEQWMASKLWQKIENLTFEEKKLFVGNQVVYRTTALCDLLLEKSDEVQGLACQQLEHLAELAELALERTCAGQLKPDDP